MTEQEEFEFRARMEAEQNAEKPQIKPVKELPKLDTLGGAAGKGFGDVVLGAQNLIGMGYRKMGETLTPDKATLSGLVTGKKDRGFIQGIGDWLVNDAQSGKKKLADELAPYKEANPTTAALGETTGNVVATLPVGGALGNVATKAAPILTRAGMSAPAAAGLAESLSTGGFRAGGLTGLKGVATRAAGGAVTGGASAALVDPANAGTGAIIGAALPSVVKIGGMAGSKVADKMTAGARSLMQSALKPTIAQRKSGDAATAIEVMLNNGINPTQGGVTKLRSLIDILNDQVKDKIANSTASVSKKKVVGALGDVEQQFGNQVSPTADLAAIRNTADDFMNHPNFVGDDIPVQAAQEMKQGTYRVLSKKFGQMGSADTEAQKALARGLKDEIATAVPGISGLNAQESQMIRALDVVERRALMDLNKNPVGLAALAHSPRAWAAMMADKSALFKSLSARMLESSANAAKSNGAKINAIANLPMLRSTALAGPSRQSE